MKKKSNRIIVYALAIAPILLWLLVYKRLPEQVPINWGFAGEITYGSKDTVWFLAFIGLALGLMADLLPKVDPRGKNYNRFGKYYDSFWIVFMIFWMALNGMMCSEIFYPGRLSVGAVVLAGMGVLFLFMGNMMPKVKSNFFMGVRTPWTIMNEDVWNKTHRLAGKVFFISGFLFLVGCFFADSRVIFYFIIGSVLVMALIPTIMSYIWYQKIVKNGIEK